MPVWRFTTVLAIGVAAASPLSAGQAAKPKGVVELFTSQGCASCPPADARLETLIRQGDVIALSYHVDYWDYLGWKDTLSSKENTERQYGYARTMGRTNVYTPQAVLNGQDHISGADLHGINAKLEALRADGKGLNVDVDAAMRGDELEINVGPGNGKANVVIAYFNKEQVIQMDKGENAGRKITYWNTVSDVQTVGMWDGKPLKLVLPASVVGTQRKQGCAVLLQATSPKGDPAAILGAAVLTAAPNGG